jgi:hypothetical protein
MEVHHPHQTTHKKKWTEYLVEFFMLFFAVFLGFLTENIREHLSEQRKEKHLIESLKKDIEHDMGKLKYVIDNMALHNNWVDSAVVYLNAPIVRGKEIWITNVLENATIWIIYTVPDITISEIRNAGAFNLIRSEKVKKEILGYMGNLNNYIKYSEPLLNARHDMDTSSCSIIGAKEMREITGLVYKAGNRGRDFLDPSDFENPIVFKTYDQAVFKGLAEKLERVNYLENDMLGQYQRLYNYDISLLKVLNEEYK